MRGCKRCCRRLVESLRVARDLVDAVGQVVEGAVLEVLLGGRLLAEVPLQLALMFHPRVKLRGERVEALFDVRP